MMYMLNFNFYKIKIYKKIKIKKIKRNKLKNQYNQYMNCSFSKSTT